MDDSLEYIKMCAKAEEIQKLYDTNEPNFLWDYTLRTAYGNKKYKEYRIYPDADKFKIPHGQHIFDCLDGYEWSCIWLPRQDQLQAMVGIENIKSSPESCVKSNAHKLVLAFYSFCVEVHSYSMGDIIEEREYTEQLESMEQLWLAFAMKELYQKRWNGEQWVKEG